MGNIHERLLSVEDDFLCAIANDSLDGFQKHNARLYDDVYSALQTGRIDHNVIALAYDVTDRIQVVAKHFLDLDVKYQNLTTSLMHDIDDVQNDEELRSLPGEPLLPPYIAAAYKWLLENLHCPYPSPSVKGLLAKQSGSTKKTIGAWFADARKRIGWSALRSNFYANKKDRIVEAAKRYFLSNQGDPAAALRFVGIRKAARELYARKLDCSLLASEVDVDASQGYSTQKQPGSSYESTVSPYPDEPSSPPTTPGTVAMDYPATHSISLKRCCSYESDYGSDYSDQDISKLVKRQCCAPNCRSDVVNTSIDSVVLLKRKRARRASDSKARIRSQHSSNRDRMNGLRIVSDPISHAINSSTISLPSADSSPSTVGKVLFTYDPETSGMQDNSISAIGVEDHLSLPFFSFDSALDGLEFNFEISTSVPFDRSQTDRVKERSVTHSPSIDNGAQLTLIPAADTDPIIFDGQFRPIPLDTDVLDRFLPNLSREDQCDSFSLLPSTSSLGLQTESNNGNANLPPIAYFNFSADSSTFPEPSYQPESTTSNQLYSGLNAASFQGSTIIPVNPSSQTYAPMSDFPLPITYPCLVNRYAQGVPTQCDIFVHEFSSQDLTSAQHLSNGRILPLLNNDKEISCSMHTSAASAPVTSVAQSAGSSKAKIELEMKLNLLLQEVDEVKTALAQVDTY